MTDAEPDRLRQEGIVLSLHSLPNNRAEILMDVGDGVVLTFELEAEAALKTVEATAKALGIAWWDER